MASNVQLLQMRERAHLRDWQSGPLSAPTSCHAHWLQVWQILVAWQLGSQSQADNRCMHDGAFKALLLNVACQHEDESRCCKKQKKSAAWQQAMTCKVFEAPPHMLPCSCKAHLSLRSSTSLGAQKDAGAAACRGLKAACLALNQGSEFWHLKVSEVDVRDVAVAAQDVLALNCEASTPHVPATPRLRLQVNSMLDKARTSAVPD